MPVPSEMVAFVAASLLLCLTPGPVVTYIVARGVTQGRRAAIASVSGVAVGNALLAVAAALGLAAVLATSAAAFSLVKYAGAAYLVYLGVQTLIGGGSAASLEAQPGDGRRVFRDALAVAVLNPKTALFFAAFVPQFVTPGPGAISVTIALSLAFVLMALVTDSIYALAAGTLAPVIARRGLPRAGRFIAAGTYIGLGVLAAISSRPTRV
ncbi:MAG: LysE family translocator [Coriobacteriia bacterium]